MTWGLNRETREELLAAVRALGPRATVGSVAHRVRKSASTVLQMLYALKIDGAVRYKRVNRVTYWTATGAAIPDAVASTAAIDAERMTHDHRALAAALRMPEIPPVLTAAPSIVHRLGDTHDQT